MPYTTRRSSSCFTSPVELTVPPTLTSDSPLGTPLSDSAMSTMSSCLTSDQRCFIRDKLLYAPAVVVARSRLETTSESPAYVDHLVRSPC